MVDHHFSFSIFIYANIFRYSHHFSDQTTSWFSDLKNENDTKIPSPSSRSFEALNNFRWIPMWFTWTSPELPSV
jgi:hypothetical protein